MSELSECVLVVEDEFIIAESLCLQIEDMGLTVCGTADTAESAIALAQQHRPFLILMDVRLKGGEDGVDAALVIHGTVGSKVIFITGSKEPAMLARIAEGEPTAVLFKPIYGRQLQTTVSRVLQ